VANVSAIINPRTKVAISDLLFIEILLVPLLLVSSGWRRMRYHLCSTFRPPDTVDNRTFQAGRPRQYV